MDENKKNIIRKYLLNKYIPNLIGEKIYYFKFDRIVFLDDFNEFGPIYKIQKFINNTLSYCTIAEVLNYDGTWFLKETRYHIPFLLKSMPNMYNSIIPGSFYLSKNKQIKNLTIFSNNLERYITFYDFRKKHLLSREAKKYILYSYLIFNNKYSLPIEMLDHILGFLRFADIGNKF